MGFELPTEERTIGDVRFRFTKLPFVEARSTLLLLTSKVMPAIKAGLASADLAGLDDGARRMKFVGAIATALGTLVERLDEADLVKLETALGTYSEYANGLDDHGEERWVRLKSPESRASIFGGGRMALYGRWLVAGVEVSFADFFGELRGLVSRAQSS